MKGLLTAFAMLCAAPLAAQDITWQLDRIKPGFAVQLQYNPGGIYTHRLRGQEGALFVIDSYFEQQQEPSFTVWVNADGNYVGLRTASGLERQYVPHDCKRTIGSCTYTQVEGNTRQTFTRVTTPDPAAGGYNYVEYNSDGSLKLRGFIALDAYGTAGDGFAVDANGAKTTYKLLGIQYP